MRLQTYGTTCFLFALALAAGCAVAPLDGEEAQRDDQVLSDEGDEPARADDSLALHGRLPWPWRNWWRPRGSDAGPRDAGVGSGDASVGSSDAGVGSSCDVTRCEASARAAQGDLVRWNMPVTTCCRTRNQCGIQAQMPAVTRPAATSIVQSLVDLQCSEPSLLALTAASFEGIADALLDGPVLPVKDGRVKTAAGGMIVLDPSCPDLSGDTGFLEFTYPGCCDAQGLCGNSNHTLPGFPSAGEPHRCLPWDELINQQSEFVPVPDATTPCRGSARSTP